MGVSVPDSYRLTYADWLRFPDDGRLWEILEGEVCVSPPPSVAHQRAVREIVGRLRNFLGARAEVLFAPLGVHLSDEEVPEPDVVVVLAAHADRIGEQAIEGAPDLVVEVLSPGTAQRDLGRKRQMYERHAVPEYWIVDPVARTVEVLAVADGRYRRAGLYGAGDRLTSPLLPGLDLAVADVFTR